MPDTQLALFDEEPQPTAWDIIMVHDAAHPAECEPEPQQPPAIVLRRIGDFYEAFDQQSAETLARAAGLVLTSRRTDDGKRQPICVIPAHALDRYSRHLRAAGYSLDIQS